MTSSRRLRLFQLKWKTLPHCRKQQAIVSKSFKERLLADADADAEAVERLIDFIEHADDFALARIKPYVLADDWSLPRRTFSKRVCARRGLGLLDLQWDLLCPLCRGPQESGSSLKDIDSQVHCETCRIDFTVNFDRFVELTFRPNHSIRTLEVRNYCIGSPRAHAACGGAAVVARQE